MMVVDFVSIPQTVSPDDITKIKDIFGPQGARVKILAKIDSKEGIQNYQKILKTADGAIFVRNEIQWEMSSEKLMLAQKWAI